MRTAYCLRHRNNLRKHHALGCLPWALIVVSASLVHAHEDAPPAASASSASGLVVRNLSGDSSGVELGQPDENGRLAGTLVFFTHRRKLEELLPKLQARYPVDTPVGIVGDVTYPGEKVFRGTLGSILDVLGQEKLPHLYLLYVGDGLKQGSCCR